jgi:hypothetical protein
MTEGNIRPAKILPTQTLRNRGRLCPIRINWIKNAKPYGTKNRRRVEVDTDEDHEVRCKENDTLVPMAQESMAYQN